ncbi:MAG TPA: hypothetical protein VI112_18630 [Bacteroidia bacterium]
METTISYSHAAAKEESKTSTFWETMEYNRFGVMYMLLMITMIPNGIAGAFALSMGWPVFALTLALAISTLSLVLGLMPMKVIFTAAGVNVLISFIIIIAGLVQSGGLLENF